MEELSFHKELHLETERKLQKSQSIQAQIHSELQTKESQLR